jgi:hypothetical protein
VRGVTHAEAEVEAAAGAAAEVADIPADEVVQEITETFIGASDSRLEEEEEVVSRRTSAPSLALQLPLPLPLVLQLEVGAGLKALLLGEDEEFAVQTLSAMQ